MENFVNEVIEALEERTGKKWKTETMKKNNGVSLTGVVIDAVAENVTSPVPIVYTDVFCNMSVDLAVDYILNIYSNCSAISYDFEHFMIRNPEVRVVNKEKNKDFLKNAPYEDLVGDLALIFIEVVDNLDGLASFRITNKMLEKANMPVEELSAIAKYNTLKHKLFSQNLGDLFRNMLDEEHCPVGEVPFQMVSLDNQRICGSRILAFPKLLDDVVEEDSYIIPSSIHECLIIPKSLFDLDFILDMVFDVNRIAVSEEEFLSDNVFEFIKDTKEIKVAS